MTGSTNTWTNTSSRNCSVLLRCLAIFIVTCVWCAWLYSLRVLIFLVLYRLQSILFKENIGFYSNVWCKPCYLDIDHVPCYFEFVHVTSIIIRLDWIWFNSLLFVMTIAEGINTTFTIAVDAVFESFRFLTHVIKIYIYLFKQLLMTFWVTMSWFFFYK